MGPTYEAGLGRKDTASREHTTEAPFPSLWPLQSLSQLRVLPSTAVRHHDIRVTVTKSRRPGSYSGWTALPRAQATRAGGTARGRVTQQHVPELHPLYGPDTLSTGHYPGRYA